MAPAHKPECDIRNILESNSRWIYRKQLRIEEKHYEDPTYVSGSRLPYLGRNYMLHVLSSNKGTATARKGKEFVFKRRRFIATVSDELITSEIKLLYEKWLEDQALRLLKNKVSQYCKVLGLDTNMLKIRIKHQRNRVGSLGRNLVLNFNRNILRLPLRIIEYVVVHELCHVFIPTHSSKYWRLVAHVISDYKKRKEWLKKNSQNG